MSMLTRWQPLGQLWREMNRFQREMDRMFDRWPGGGIGGGFAPAFPPLNVWEDGEFVYAEAELPGLKLDNLEIYVTGTDQLTLKGERQVPEVGKGVWHRQERGFGTFSRVVTLPVPVDANQVEARLEHGVLTIKMAKSEAAKPRKITVKAE
jgi:HSP20 family protein